MKIGMLMYVAIFCACAVFNVGVLGLPYPVDIVATLVMSLVIAMGAEKAIWLLRK